MDGNCVGSSRNKNRSGRRGKGSSDEALSTLVSQVQTTMKQDLLFKEVHIPNSKAEARCKIFLSPNYAQCEKLVLFIQPGKGN